MEFLNSQYFMIAVVAGVLLICYAMWREVNKTKVDIADLKNFSNKVVSFIDNSAARQPVQVAVTQAVSKTDEPEVIEEKDE